MSIEQPQLVIEEILIGDDRRQYLAERMRYSIGGCPVSRAGADSFMSAGVERVFGGLDMQGERVLSGVALSQVRGDEPLRVSYLWVDGSARMLGHGRAMMDFVEGFAKERGKQEVDLLSVATAVGFYSRLGYELTSPNTPSKHMIKRLD